MIFELIQSPYVQALSFLLLTILTVLIIRPKSADSIWVVAGLIFIGFIVLNSVLIVFQSGVWSYFLYSLLFSGLYLVGIALVIPALVKWLNVEGSEESGMIFLYIIYHPVCLLLMMGLKWAYLKFF